MSFFYFFPLIVWNLYANCILKVSSLRCLQYIWKFLPSIQLGIKGLELERGIGIKDIILKCHLGKWKPCSVCYHRGNDGEQIHH